MPSHLSLRRIVVIAVLAIIVPSLVLTLVGLKLTLDLKRQLEQSLAEQYAVSARAKAEEIEAQVAALEERVKRKANKLEPQQIAPTLDGLLGQPSVVEDVFLLDERALLNKGVPPEERGAMLYPQEPEPPAAAPETMLWTEPFPRVSRDGAPTSVAGSAKYLQELGRYRERAVSPTARIRATQVVAATLFRLGQYREAIAEYRRLVDVDDAAAFSPSLALLARYQIAAARAELEPHHDALTTLLDLYADLVRGHTRAADPGRIAYFKQRTRNDIESLLTHPDVPLPDRRRYESLSREEKRRESRAQFLAYLRRFVLPRLELQARTLKLEEDGFRHLWDDEFADEPYVVAYAAVRAADGSRRILGFKLNIRHVRNEILPKALGSSRYGPRVGFVVADRTDKAVFGQPTGSFAAAEPFPKIFKSWKLALVERRAAELRRLALYNVLLFTAVNGLMIVAIIIGVVITLRGTARELELSQLKSDFVSNVSHELKTPLALIRMFAETLELGRTKSPEKVQEYYSIITRESERLTQLINNVLDFSRIEGGRKTYDLRLDDLADIVRDTLRAYSYELDKQNFTVVTAIDAVPETLLDRNAISLAILNLLSNAVKYSGEDKRIRVGCAARNGVLVVEVTDHGLGIDQADLERIFDKFYRARDERVRATRGSGLGLAIVKHSIDAHGGTIAVASEKGQGSTFTITLPIRSTLTDGKNPGR